MADLSEYLWYAVTVTFTNSRRRSGFISTSTNPAVSSLTESLDDDVAMVTPGASSLSHDAVDNVISVRHDDVICSTPHADKY